MNQDMVVDPTSDIQVDRISLQKIGKAGKVARLTLAASLALNNANLNDFSPGLYHPNNERFDLATNIGAGPNFGIQIPEIRPPADSTRYGAFYYGHRATDSTSLGITDWYRGLSRRAVGPKGNNNFYEEQYGPDDDRRIKEDISQMMYGNLDFAISSWDSKNDARDQFMKHLKSLYNTPDWPYKNFSWSFIYEKEGYGDPSEEEINSDLTYMDEEYFNEPWFLKNEEGKPVLFIYSSDSDREGYLNKWAKISKERGIEAVLKSYHGYEFLSELFSNPNVDEVKWYDYQPAYPVIHNRDSVMISPQYIRKGDSRRHIYLPKKWEKSVSEMVASGADYGLIISWNERYEHTGVKPQKIYVNECPTDGNYPLDSSMLDALRKYLPANPSYQETQTQEINQEQIIFNQLPTKEE